MQQAPRRRPLFIALLLAALASVAVFAVWFATRSPTPVVAEKAPSLSDLATPPDWSRLDPYQESIPRRFFEEQMDSVFTMSNRWRDFIKTDAAAARIDTGSGKSGESICELRFAPNAASAAPKHRWWRPASELGPAPPGKPLAGLHVAIDPGHLGGRWARMEERWFQVGSAKPVTEGDLTLKVARLLKPRLESLGARVTLVRNSTEPLTDWRPESLMKAGLIPENPDASPEKSRRLAEKLFYRSAEIRARARKINGEIRPDLVLCLHFNAEGWGDPRHPRLIKTNHFHMLISGAFTDGEVALADQRFDLLMRLLQGIHSEEASLGATAATVFAQRTGLPPYRYETNSKRARNIAGNPYLWARNLLANRLYLCPVLFYEPYVMNSREVHARIQAGDYPDTRTVAGTKRPSIFREYADAVAAGLSAYYSKAR